MEIGFIDKIDNENAYIRVMTSAACKTCSSKGVCLAQDKPLTIKIPNDQNFQKGQKVEFEIIPQKRLLAGFMIFILPLIFMIAFFLLGINLLGSEGFGILFGLGGFLVSLGFLKILNKKVASSTSFLPKNIRIIK